MFCVLQSVHRCALTNAWHSSISWKNSIPSLQHLSNINLMFFSPLWQVFRLDSFLQVSRPHPITVLFSTIRTECLAHPILLQLLVVMTRSAVYKLWRSSMYPFFQPSQQENWGFFFFFLFIFYLYVLRRQVKRWRIMNWIDVSTTRILNFTSFPRDAILNF